jgi:hypothetical protein
VSTRSLNFDQLILQAVDDSLSVMGEEPKRAMYQDLLTIHSLRKEDIPFRISEFVSGLKKALGTASKVVEKLILKKLYERIGTTFQESQGLEFRDYIDDARSRFEMRDQVVGSNDSSVYGQSKKSQFPS